MSETDGETRRYGRMSNYGKIPARKTRAEDTSSHTAPQTESGPAVSDAESNETGPAILCPAIHIEGPDGRGKITHCGHLLNHKRVLEDASGLHFDHGNDKKGVYWNEDTLGLENPICGKVFQGVTCALPADHDMAIDTYNRAWDHGSKWKATYWMNDGRVSLPPHDAVNNPSHYSAGRRYEPIDVIEDWELGFNLGNTVKYISRAGRKDDVVQDLEKAKWYLEREISRLRGE